MSSTPFMLNPVPMTFNLKSFEIVLDFKDEGGKMTLELSEQKRNSADVVKLMVRDKNNFAIFRGSKNEEREVNDDISSNMEYSASGTLIRDEDLVTFALMWIDKLITEEQKDIMVLTFGGRFFPVFVPKNNPGTEASNSENENTNAEYEFNFDINGPLTDMMKNFADLMDHFLQ